MLKIEQLLRVAELVKQGLGPSEIQRVMHFASLHRATRAIARVKKYPDLEWSCVSGNRRKILNPADPRIRPTLEELEAFLRRLLLPDAQWLGPAFTRWVLKFARVNGFDDLAKELVEKNARVRSFAWTPEKAELLRKVRAARRGESSGGGVVAARGPS